MKKSHVVGRVLGEEPEGLADGPISNLGVWTLYGLICAVIGVLIIGAALLLMYGVWTAISGMGLWSFVVIPACIWTGHKFMTEL
jgi:hypothetical protein